VKKFIVTVNGTSYEVDVVEKKETSIPIIQKMDSPPVKRAVESISVVQPVKVEKIPSAPVKSTTSANTNTVSGVSVTAPMPGTILELKVKLEDKVSRGQVLVVLEAMKMENEIVAPKDGVVNSIGVSVGNPVKGGDVLLSIV